MYVSHMQMHLRLVDSGAVWEEGLMADDDSARTERRTSPHDDEVIGDLVRAFTALRRQMIKPATATLPLPSVGRHVDLAKILACHAVADAAEGSGGVPPTVKDVAIALELDHSTASRVLGDAEAEGLVVRGTDPADRRRATLSLTDLGRAVARESVEMQKSVLGQTLAGWKPDEVRTLVRLIERLTESLHAELPRILRQFQRDLADGHRAEPGSSTATP